MRVLKAIGQALAAMMMTVVVWSEELGIFIMKCRPGYGPPDPNDVVHGYGEVAKSEAAAAADKPDEKLVSIQQVVDLLFHQQPIPDDALVGIGEKTLIWLEALNADMLLLASKSRPEDLSAHMKGTRAIRGLLAYDRDSITAYQQALQRDAEAKKPDRRHHEKGEYAALPSVRSTVLTRGGKGCWE